MSYYYILIPIREPVLMHLDEDEVVESFEREGRPDRRKASPSMLARYERPGMDDVAPPPISLGTKWIALHHLLTGSFASVASPLSWAIDGKTRFSTRGLPGRVMYLWAHEVREVSDALSVITPDYLRRRFDPAALRAEFSTGLDEDVGEETLFAKLLGYFELLVPFYRIAARRGDAVLMDAVYPGA
jgi:hypothetical protein